MITGAEPATGAGDQVFAVGDFDEGYLGQFVWDVRRLAASMVLAGREKGQLDSDIGTAINTMVGANRGRAVGKQPLGNL